jgi:flagellin-like hook-associated protein FlgL
MNEIDVTVDLSGSATLDDIRTAFETAVTAAGLPALSMELDGAAMNIISTSGETWSISNESGDSTADNLGLVGTGRPARLFGTLEALADALRADDIDGIRDAIGELDGLEQHVLEIEIDIGSKQNMLEWMEGRLSERNYSLNSNLSRIRDADVIEVASGLTQAETAYQASLLVSSKLLQTNLFQYL